jgi:tRNA A-37 threonylcarbamoyl transferase component Bud32
MVSCVSCGTVNRGAFQYCVSCGKPLPEDASVIERYHLDGVLGRGALSTVYQATDAMTGNTVAVKALNPEFVTRAELRQRLRTEARTLQRLSHPNIVGVIDFVETGQAVWLVTESVEGTSLRNVLIHARRLEPEQALSIFTGLLAGLAYAHERGLAHGDLKPENVLVEASGTARLADFGQAVPAGHATTGGTAAYMSPEAVRGEALGPAADLYSVGAVLYEALTGRPPLLAATEEALLRLQLTGTPEPISDLPETLWSLVASLLDKDPARRPPSATAALSAFESAVRDAYGSEWRRRAGVASLVETTAANFPTLTDGVLPDDGKPGPGAGPPFQPSAAKRVITAEREPGRAPGRPPLWRRHWLLASLATVTVVAGLVAGVLAATSGTGPSRPPSNLAAGGTPSASGRSKSPASPPTASATASHPVVIRQGTTLSSDVFCSDLTIEPGVTLTTNGHNIYCSGTVDNKGTIVTGPSAPRNFPLSYGGSGGGSTDLGGPASPGFSTRTPGGAPCNASGCTAANGSSPALPGLTPGTIRSWYRAGMDQYLAGAGGGSTPVVHGGTGANGLFIEADRIIAGNIVCAGGAGQNQPGQSSAGGGGGGVVILAYVSSLTPGSYACGGGYTTTADGTHHEFGGNGVVAAHQLSSLPVLLAGHG